MYAQVKSPQGGALLTLGYPMQPFQGKKVKKPTQGEFTVDRYCLFSSCRYSFAGRPFFEFPIVYILIQNRRFSRIIKRPFRFLSSRRKRLCLIKDTFCNIELNIIIQW